MVKQYTLHFILYMIIHSSK